MDDPNLDQFNIDYNEIYGERDGQPNIETDFNKAKTYLQRQSSDTGDNLYDHLTEVLNKILAERPDNIVDFFEDYSRKIKEARYKDATDHLHDIYVAPEQFHASTQIKPLITPVVVKEDGDVEAEPVIDEEDLEDERDKVDLMESLYYFEQVGVGIPRQEMFLIFLAIRKLNKAEPILKCRFWGKIYGLEKDYLVCEAQLTEEELVRLEGEAEAAEQARLEEETRLEEEREAAEAEAAELAAVEAEAAAEEEEKKVPRKLPPVPKAVVKPEPVVPFEKPGTGVNKKVFYVCNHPAENWILLPDVTPQQIMASRQFVKYFTGNLDAPIETYPPFPGTERNYLRAQIGRISAGAQVAPLGMFSFTEGEEEEAEDEGEEGAIKTDYFPNHNYEPVPLGDLTDGTMSFWVHKTLYILQQGRTVWWNPRAKGEGEEEEEVGEEEDEEPPPEPEIGPPLLTPLSEDASMEAIPPWTVRSSSKLIVEKAIAIIRSNLWPGAYAFAAGKKCENIYLGFGHKVYAYNYTPPPLATIMEDYPIGPEILEMKDPSGVEEEAWRLAHEKPMGEEGEHEEEDEDAE